MQDLLEFLASPAVAVPLALLGFGVLVTAYACGALKCGTSASYGSGVNPIWNSFIDDNPPLPNSKKLRMAHGWEFKGSHGKPGTVDCPGEDGLTGGELTGHLIGRQVWVPTGQAADTSPPYEPFDASSNQVRAENPHISLAQLARLPSADTLHRTRATRFCGLKCWKAADWMSKPHSAAREAPCRWTMPSAA